MGQCGFTSSIKTDKIIKKLDYQIKKMNELYETRKKLLDKLNKEIEKSNKLEKNLTSLKIEQKRIMNKYISYNLDIDKIKKLLDTKIN